MVFLWPVILIRYNLIFAYHSANRHSDGFQCITKMKSPKRGKEPSALKTSPSSSSGDEFGVCFTDQALETSDLFCRKSCMFLRAFMQAIKAWIAEVTVKWICMKRSSMQGEQYQEAHGSARFVQAVQRCSSCLMNLPLSSKRKSWWKCLFSRLIRLC